MPSLGWQMSCYPLNAPLETPERIRLFHVQPVVIEDASIAMSTDCCRLVDCSLAVCTIHMAILPHVVAVGVLATHLPGHNVTGVFLCHPALHIFARIAGSLVLAGPPLSGRARQARGSASHNPTHAPTSHTARYQYYTRFAKCVVGLRNTRPR